MRVLKTFSMEGQLYLVSLGPGDASLIPPMARDAIRRAGAVVGYGFYFTWIRDWLEGKEVHDLPLTRERQRAALAIRLAREGKIVALLSSGDIGIYGMAPLVHEMLGEDEPFSLTCIPGISAVQSAASLLGAPLALDFATLSLSDLLCPWEMIERKARALASGDFVVGLYNVQSQQRQEGVYRILDLFLEHKQSGTWCGMVRNAYREGQSLEICALGELVDKKFDMLTTLVIGNALTQRVGGRMYNPRGYLGLPQPEPNSANVSEKLPAGAVWVFSGTGEGNLVAAGLIASGIQVVLSCASEQGRALASQACPEAFVVAGRLGLEKRLKMMAGSGARMIVDATHPFSVQMSEQLLRLSEVLNIPHLRLDRPRSQKIKRATYVSDFEAAGFMAVEKGKRILLATGSKELEAILKADSAREREWFLRLSPEPEMLTKALDCGIPRKNICAMLGPFSKTANVSLMREWKIDCLVTKDSGGPGGFDEKVSAAKKLGIELVVVKRPEKGGGNSFGNVDELIDGVKLRLRPQA